MRREDYDDMHALESDFWWFAGMREITGALLGRFMERAPRDVLDSGCGTGINLLWMLRRYRPERVIGMDFSRDALYWSRETLLHAASLDGLHTAPRLARGDVRVLPFAGDCFDLVTSLDVLDLFDPGDDVRAMKELHRVLRPGGFAYVREPACQWLMSSHDRLFETQRRYSPRELGQKMGEAGFDVIQTTYANTLLFPIAASWRLLRRLLKVSAERTDTRPWPKYLGWLNAPFQLCLELEARWLGRGLRLPIGLSAICIGRKRPAPGPR